MCVSEASRLAQPCGRPVVYFCGPAAALVLPRVALHVRASLWRQRGPKGTKTKSQACRRLIQASAGKSALPRAPNVRGRILAPHEQSEEPEPCARSTLLRPKQRYSGEFDSVNLIWPLKLDRLSLQFPLGREAMSLTSVDSTVR